MLAKENAAAPTVPGILCVLTRTAAGAAVLAAAAIAAIVTTSTRL